VGGRRRIEGGVVGEVVQGIEFHGRSGLEHWKNCQIKEDSAWEFNSQPMEALRLGDALPKSEGLYSSRPRTHDQSF